MAKKFSVSEFAAEPPTYGGNQWKRSMPRDLRPKYEQDIFGNVTAAFGEDQVRFVAEQLIRVGRASVDLGCWNQLRQIRPKGVFHRLRVEISFGDGNNRRMFAEEFGGPGVSNPRGVFHKEVFEQLIEAVAAVLIECVKSIHADSGSLPCDKGEKRSIAETLKDDAIANLQKVLG